MLGRHQRAADGRREALVDERAIEPRAALWPRYAAHRPDVEAGRAVQHRVGDQQGKNVVVRERRRVKRRLPIGGGAFLAQHHAPLRLLLRLDLPDLRRPRSGRDAAEMLLRRLQHVVGVDVADDHQRGVGGHVVAPVMPVEVVARHRLQIRQPADGRVVIRMDLERGRGDFGVEQLLGIVLAALQLRDDDRALGLAIRRVVEARVHPLGLDEQHAIERVVRRRLEVGGLVDPGVAVPGAAELLDDALDLVARNVPRALEVHVLAPVRHAGHARAFVLRADAIPAPHRRQRRGVHFANEDLQAVVREPFHAPSAPSPKPQAHSPIITIVR